MALKMCDLLYVVHACDSGICFAVLRKSHEAKATAATSVAVLNDDLICN